MFMENKTIKFLENGSLRQAQLKMLAMLQMVDHICQKHGLDYWLEGGTLLGAVRHQGFIPWDDDLDISMPRDSFNKFLQLAEQELPEHMRLQSFKTDKGFYNLSVQLKIRDCNSRYLEERERGDEPYRQGIYVDIFAYDKKPVNPLKRKFYTVMGKKLCRVLFHKYAPTHLYRGHYAKAYKTMGRLLPKKLLEHSMQRLITKANNSNSPYLGYGYDCINGTYFTVDDYYPLKRGLFEGQEFNIPNRADVILRHQFGDYMTMPPEEKRVLKHCRELIPHC
jgi:lipopolysaccharide cholinephosphotransferase